MPPERRCGGGETRRGTRTASPGLFPAEAEVLAVRLADLVWAGLRGLPGSSSPRTVDE